MSKISKLVPKGFDFSKETWERAFKENIPLVIVPFISNRCNIDCTYCMMKDERKKSQDKGLTLEEHKKIIKDAYALGCRTVVVTGLGEPFLDPIFYNHKDKTFPLVEYASSLGMYTIVFTNGLFITKEIANKLINLKISLILKLSSLDEEQFSMLNDSKVKFEEYIELDGRTTRIPYYLKNLLEAGFCKELEEDTTRLISDIIITKKNINDIAEVLDFSFRNNMLACIDPLVIKSAARDNYDELGITEEENNKLYLNIKEKFSNYDMNMFDLSNCIIHHNGLVYDLEGNIRQCLSVPSNCGNIREESLENLWKKISKLKKESTEKYKDIVFEDIFGKCPGRCFYNGIHN